MRHQAGVRSRPEKAAAYAAALKANSDPQGQLEQAIFEKDLQKACSLLRSLVVHAAGEPGVNMTGTLSLSSHLQRG